MYFDYPVLTFFRFLYTMVIAIDANFRLKRRAVSSNNRDPALGSGWGFFVENIKYREHVLRYADQEDVRTARHISLTGVLTCWQISTCTGFAALARANTKWQKGYATTGVGIAVDARHGFVLPNGVGDLQKGER